MKKRTVFYLTAFLLFPFSSNASFITIKNADAPEKFALYSTPKTGPSAQFFNQDKQKVSLKDFAGKIVMVNVWSTACRQCTAELPMLDHLQKTFGTKFFKIIPLSVGKESVGEIKRFFVQNQYKNLTAYADNQGAFSLASGVIGLPTTLLFDVEGREIGRIKGIAEWSGPVIKAQIRSLIKQEMKKRKETTPNDDETQKTMSLQPEDVSSWFKK